MQLSNGYTIFIHIRNLVNTPDEEVTAARTDQKSAPYNPNHYWDTSHPPNV